MEYCAHNLSVHVIWRKGAFNPCFMDTFSSAIIFVVVGSCALIELRMYIQHGTKLDAELLGESKPRLYMAQMWLSGVLVAVQALRLAVQSIEGLEGHSLVKSVLLMTAWCGSATLVWVERNYDLPSQPARAHSICLLVFWAVSLALDTFQLFFLILHRAVHAALLLLFLVQWFAELFIFLLGIRAPGLVSNTQRNRFLYRPISESPSKYGSVAGNGSTSERSAASLQILRKTVYDCQLSEDAFRALDGRIVDWSLSIAKLDCNQSFNRYSNILPYDFNRVVLGLDGYINASWITMNLTNQDIERKYIVTQGPKLETIGHFWEMVWQEKVAIIIMLTDLIENSLRKCEQYWPPLGETMEFGNLIVSCSEYDHSRSKYLTKRELFMIKMNSDGKVEERTVNQLQLHGWSSKDVKKVVELRKVADSMHRRLYPTGLVAAPVVVHCSTGVDRTGAYILMDTLARSVECAVPVDPFHVVTVMREQRMAMVQTAGQFMLACRAALAYTHLYVQK